MGLYICAFLSGLFLICDGLHVVGPSGPLTLELGGSLMLPCYVESPLPLEELEVEWKRTDPESLVHLFQDGESRPEAQSQTYSGRASFFTEEIKHGNFSLLLTDLTIKDAGVYSCTVYTQQETGQTSVEIKEPERLIVTGGHDIFAHVGEEITLNCFVDTHIPLDELEEVSWKKVNLDILLLIFEKGVVMTESTAERYMDRVASFDEEIHKGNFSLRLKDLQTEDNGLYICEVFSGEFSASTTVEVQLGFSNMYIGILFLCVLAFGFPVLLSYTAWTALKTKENNRATLAVQYTLVFCPNIIMFLAFILWGVVEGSINEAATCSALILLRIFSLLWIASYFDTLKVSQCLTASAVVVEYVGITIIAFIGPYRHVFTSFKAVLGIFGTVGWIALYMFILPCKVCIKHIPWRYGFTEVTNFGRLLFIILIYGSLKLLSVLVLLPLIFLCHLLTNTLLRLLMSTASTLILLAANASISIYLHYDLLTNEKEQDVLTCTTAYLHILSVITLFQGSRFRVPIQQNLIHTSVYMFGAVGLILVNAVALSVELILKARNGERTVKDLRVIFLPFECAFALCCLTLQISAFCAENSEKLKGDLENLCKLCRCKRVSRDQPLELRPRSPPGYL